MSDNLNRSRLRPRAFTLVELPAVSRRKRGAFTLVELLVVIGIIAILISVLLPVLSAARRSSNKAACLASLRQIGAAFKLYEVEYKGAWPAAIHYYYASPGNRRERRWHDFIAKYLIGSQSIADAGVTYTSKEMNGNGTASQAIFDIIPAASHGEFGTATDPIWIGTMRSRKSPLWGCPDWMDSTIDYANPGYAMSWFPMSPNDIDPATLLTDYTKVAVVNSVGTIIPPGMTPGKFYRVNHWRTPAQRALIFDAASAHGFFSVNLTQFPWTDLTFPSVPNTTTFPLDYNRHGRRKTGNKSSEPSLNVLFCDGHAEFVSCRQAYRAMRFSE